MHEIDELWWKRVCQAVGDDPEVTQENIQHGDDSERQYLKKGLVIARMVVYGANTYRPALLNVRRYWCTQELIHEVKDIEILSDEQWQEISDDFDDNIDAWRAAQ